MSQTDDDLATREEVVEALRRLSHADLLRVEGFARYRSYGLPWLDWQDLFHEAIKRTLNADRRWPKHVPFVIYMRECIRSIAHEELRHRTRGPIRTEADIGSREEEGVSTNPYVDAPDPAPGAERQLAASQALDAILRAFDGDRVALAVMRGLADGSTPDDICRAAGITRTDYESAQRRIRRRLLRDHVDPNRGTLQ